MSWSVLVLPVVICVALLVLPGLFLVLATGQKGLDALALSLPVSVATIGLSAIVAPLLGIRWSIAVPCLSGLILALLTYPLMRLLQRYRWWDTPLPLTAGSPSTLSQSQWWGPQSIYSVLGFFLGVALLGRGILGALGSPDAIGQSFDELFHLNAVRYIAEEGNASSFFVGTMTIDADSSFYPAAWHAIPALALGAAQDSVRAAVNSMALTVGAFVWPISTLYMVRHILRNNPVSLVGTGAISASFIAFPFLLMRWGILYPNSLGIALIPVGIGLAAQIFRLAHLRTLASVQGIFLGIFVCLGIGLAHPNAALTLLVLCLPMVVVRMYLQVRAAFRGQLGWLPTSFQLLALFSCILVLGVLWVLVRPDIEAGRHWVPELTASQAVGEGLVNGVMNTGALWAVSLLMIVGIFVTVAQRDKKLWILGSWLVAMFFLVAIRHLDYDEGRYEITGVWYQDAYRVAAFTPVVALPLAACGLSAMSQKLVDSFSPILRGRVKEGVLWAALILVFLAPLTYWTQNAVGYTEYLQKLKKYYTVTDSSYRVSNDEIALLQEIKGILPPGSTIVVNPEDGGAYAYAISGYEVTSKHILADVTEDERTLKLHFDEAATDPDVCPAMRRENAFYALDFTPPPGQQKASGFDRLGEDLPGYTQIDRVGAVGLYRADLCM
ncbi:DUF6541 family protein [Rothia sp. P5764]|uniref:DUF6541 family protein n=1 Tax=Rothia sp. P5764 TaxID=3402654 RepID=UPI003AC70720